MNKYLDLIRSQVYSVKMNAINIEEFHERNNIYHALSRILESINILEHNLYKNSLEYQMSRSLPQEKL